LPYDRIRESMMLMVLLTRALNADYFCRSAFQTPESIPK
jgi:hypothetical protein